MAGTGEIGHDEDGIPYAVVYVEVGIDIIEELPVEECPTCGHMSVTAAIAALTLNGVAQNVGKYTRCAEGCDDDPITVTVDPDDD